MKYIELREEEKAELRETLLAESIDNDGYTDYNYLSEEEQKIVDNCLYPWEIPEEIMISAFSSYDFVPHDFWCNV